MQYYILGMLLLTLALCHSWEEGKVVTKRTPFTEKWITLKGYEHSYLCSTPSSFYYSYSMKEECRWKVIRGTWGYIFMNIYGKYLSGNREYYKAKFSSHIGDHCVWKLYEGKHNFVKFTWILINHHYSTELLANNYGPRCVKNAQIVSQISWQFNFLKEKRNADLHINSKSTTCIRGASGKYIGISSSGNRIIGSSVCDKKSQWSITRTSDYRHTIYNSYFKKYLVFESRGKNKLSSSPKNGKWIIHSHKKGYLIKSEYSYFIVTKGQGSISHSELLESNAIWKLETHKIEKKKEKIANLHAKKYKISLYYVPKKQYLTSSKSNYYLSKKNIDSLWFAVPVGKKVGKHYLVNFEGKYLTATSTSATLSSKMTNKGLWKIEKVNNKYWRLKNIQTGKYLDFSNSKFSMSSKSNPKWMVYGFGYSDGLSKKFSKPISFYNSKNKKYISIKLGHPKMASEASPLTIKKYGLFYNIYYQGKYLNLNSDSLVPKLSNVKNSHSFYKIHKKSNGFYEFVPYKLQGSKLGVTSSGHLKALNSDGKETEWQLSTYKKPLPKPVKTLPKAFKGKIATFMTPNGKYLGADDEEKKIVLTTVLKDSYWTLVQKGEGIFHIISAYKTYLTLGSKGLYQSKTPKEGSKWKIIIKGNKWAIQNAVNHKYISITNEQVFIFTKKIYYWNFEAISIKNTYITVYVENPKDYLGTGLYFQSKSKMFLKYEDNKIVASANEDSLWKIIDASNGMFYVATSDNYYLHSAKEGKKAVLKKDLTDKAKWKIEIKNDKWEIQSYRYATYLSLNKKNELVCSKKQYKWQVKAVTPSILNRNIFIQDQKSKLFLGEDFDEVKMLSEPISDAYIVLTRKRANIVSIADSWNNNIIESNKKISFSYDLPNEGLWYIQENKKGVVFKNKVSGRYLYYDSKGKLTTTFNQAKALWTIYIA